MMAVTKTLRVGLIQPVQGLDRPDSADFINLVVPWQIYEPPYGPTATDEPPEPLLFKDALVREPGQAVIWSAELRDGVRFSDGTPLTLDQVVRCLSAIGSLRVQTDISVSGDRILFQPKRAFARFEPELTMLSRSIVLKTNAGWLGTGAYVPAPGSTPLKMRLTRNPYYRHPVAIEEIEFQVFPPSQDGSNPELKRAVAEGRIDYTAFLRRDEVNDLTSVRKCVEAGNSAAVLFFNTERGIFRDRLVRQAVAFAINRFEIAHLFYQNPLAYVGMGPTPPGLDRVADNIAFDLARAKKLLEKIGFVSPGEPLRMATICGNRPYLPLPQVAAEKIASQLKALGFTVSIEPTKNAAEYYERTASGDYDLVLGGWIPDTPDAADILDAFLYSGAVPGNDVGTLSCSNIARWRDAEMDRALQSYRADRSDASKKALSGLLERDVPLLTLMYGAAIHVHTWRLRNYPVKFPVQARFAAFDIAD